MAKAQDHPCQLGVPPIHYGQFSRARCLIHRSIGLRIQRPDIGEETGMQIEERVVGNVTILDLKGKVTLGEGDEVLKDKINSLIHQDRKRILLNFADVPYIDSAGLGEIVRT